MIAKTITFQFVTAPGIQSAAIRWRTNSSFSHVDIVVPAVPTCHPEQLLGARLEGGVAIRPLDYAKFSRKVRVTVPIGATYQNVFFLSNSWLLQQVGKPYDWRAIAGIELNRNWRDDDAWFCSELGAAYAEECGCFVLDEMLAGTRINFITPEILRLLLIAPGRAIVREIIC